MTNFLFSKGRPSAILEFKNFEIWPLDFNGQRASFDRSTRKQDMAIFFQIYKVAAVHHFGF